MTCDFKGWKPKDHKKFIQDPIDAIEKEIGGGVELSDEAAMEAMLLRNQYVAGAIKMQKAFIWPIYETLHTEVGEHCPDAWEEINNPNHPNYDPLAII